MQCSKALLLTSLLLLGAYHTRVACLSDDAAPVVSDSAGLARALKSDAKKIGIRGQVAEHFSLGLQASYTLARSTFKAFN